MPHLTPDNILAITYEELIDAGLFKNENSIAAKVSRDLKRGYGVKKVRPGKGLNSNALIDYDSLPRHMKARIPDPREEMHVLEEHFRIEKDIIDFYADFRFPDEKTIDDEVQEVYVANACVLRAVWRLKEARINQILKLNRKPKKLKIWQSLASDLESFKPILAAKYEMTCTTYNYRRLEEKVKQFRDEGPVVLISGNHGNTNRKKVDHQTLAVLESLFGTQSHKPTFTEVSQSYESFINGYTEIINNATGELYNPKEFPKLSKATIYNYLSAWDSKIGTYTLRSGDRQKHMGAFKPHHSLDIPKFAGSIISVDDRQPPFTYGNNKRPWFYLGIDLASECYTTWVYGDSKEGIIIDFYRQMVRNYHQWGINLPAEIECESSLNSTLKNSILREGTMFEYVRMEANNARGKRIERYFRELRYTKEKKLAEFICRPFAISESNQQGPQKSKELPYENIIKGSLNEIQNWNNSEHSHCEGKTRWEYFLENQNPKIKPTNYRAIIPHIGYKTKTSCNVGIVRLQNSEFLLGNNGTIYTGEKLIHLMRLAEGEQLEVYWLDDNDGNVMKAYAYIGTQFVCELIEKPKYQRAKIEQTPDDLEKRQIMSAYVATVDAYSRKRKNMIEKVTVINHQPTTLNNKFQIRELAQSAIINKEINNIDDVEILPDLPEFEADLNTVETTYKRPTLEERY